MAISARPRIGIVLPDLRGGGAERVGITLASGFADLGYPTDIVLMSVAGEFLDLVPSTVRIVPLNAPRARNVLISARQYVRSQRPGALIVNMWPLTVVTWLGAVLANTRCRVVGVDHNILSRSTLSSSWLRRGMLKYSIRVFYPHFTARVAVSHGVAEDLARLSGLTADSFHVIYNPIASPEPYAVNLVPHSIWNYAPAGCRILSVGGLKPQKNHELLIRAFSLLQKTGTYQLVILGEGPLRSDLEQIITSTGLDGHVLLPGFRNPAPYYASADLFVLSSDYEGFGNVLVEALAYGLPIVSTDCPTGPAEILEHGRYGKLAPVRDAEMLAKAMEEALMDGANNSAGRRRARDFLPDRTIQQYLALLTGEAH